MNKKDIDSVTVAVINSMSFGAPRPEHYRQKLGSATKVAGINTSLVAEALTHTASRL